MWGEEEENLKKKKKEKKYLQENTWFSDLVCIDKKSNTLSVGAEAFLSNKD